MLQNRSRVVAGGALWLWIMAGFAQAQPPNKPAEAEALTGMHEVIAQGTHSAIEAPRKEVLRDAEAFIALWAAHAAGSTPPISPPGVDFSGSTVVAVFAGNQPTGGHALSVSGLDKTASGWSLKLSLAKPGPDCMVTQVITQPWVMVRVPGAGQSVKIEIAEVTRSCGR